MKKIENNFIVLILVANLFAVVFYGGRYILTGSIEEPKQEEIILVKSKAIQATPVAAAISSAPATVAVIIGDASKGKRVAGRCKACHGFKQGGKHKMGPNLWGIFNQPIATRIGYNYSSAFKAKTGTVTWDEATLSTFLTKPKKFVKGTKMAFPGLRKEKDRANLIAWLKEQSNVKAPAPVAAVPAPAPAVIIGNANKGKRVAGRCKACHGFKQGGKHKMGPNLWGIFNQPIATRVGYNYSSAFKAKTGTVTWDEATLSTFLTKPKKFVKGTKMAFPGLRKEKDRANLIAWLKEQQ